MAIRSCSISARGPMLRRSSERTSTERGRRSTESVAIQDVVHSALDGVGLGLRMRRLGQQRRRRRSTESVLISLELHPDFRLLGGSLDPDAEGIGYHE